MIEEELSVSTLTNLLAPVVGALIFGFVFLYLTVVRKRIVEVYPFYSAFVLSFVIFLLGRPVQMYFEFWENHYTLYVRMGLLHGIGMPSLLVAASIQSRLPYRKQLFWIAYGVGGLISILYCLTVDAVHPQMFLDQRVFTFFGLPKGYAVAHTIQFFGSLILLVIPCFWLLIREWNGSKNTNLIAYLSGSLLMGVFMVIATPHPMRLEFIYVGSIVSAICWVWAVFQDIRDMTGKVDLLKDELQMLVKSGNQIVTPEVEKLLNDLERYSEGNIGVYKMRIREILNRLTDVTIQAGGDSDALVRRNLERTQLTEASDDPEFIRNVVKQEATELSEIIATIPEKKTNKLVEDAKQYIKGHFAEDLSVNQIVEHFSVSRSHFMRLFKKETGKTVNQFLTETRIAHAKQLLATSKSVTESAFECGFNDSNYFSTVFKKQTGMTPVQYQKSMEASDGLN